MFGWGLPLLQYLPVVLILRTLWRRAEQHPAGLPRFRAEHDEVLAVIDHGQLMQCPQGGLAVLLAVLGHERFDVLAAASSVADEPGQLVQDAFLIEPEAQRLL